MVKYSGQFSWGSNYVKVKPPTHKVSVKKKQPICSKICAAHFDKKRATILWFASGFVRQARNTVLRRFLPNAQPFLPNVP